MNEYKLDNITLMGGWFIPEKVCDNLIDYFNNNKNLHRIGYQGTGGKDILDTTVKESTDLIIKFNDENEYVPHLQKCLELYIENYLLLISESGLASGGNCMINLRAI